MARTSPPYKRTSMSRGYKKITYKNNNKFNYNKSIKMYKQVFGGFTPVLVTKLKYIQYCDFDAGATTAAVNVFRINNPYDPDETGTGHQPMWWDTYSAIYSQVRVTKCTIKMTNVFSKISNVALGNSTLGTTDGTFTEKYFANERACRMFILRDESPTDYPNNLDIMIEQGNTNFTWKWVPQTTDSIMPMLKYTCVPHKQLDLDKKDGRNAIQTNGSVPTDFRPLYFICGISSIDSTNNPSNTRCMFEIDYEVEFYDRFNNQSQQ